MKERRSHVNKETVKFIIYQRKKNTHTHTFLRLRGQIIQQTSRSLSQNKDDDQGFEGRIFRKVRRQVIC